MFLASSIRYPQLKKSHVKIDGHMISLFKHYTKSLFPVYEWFPFDASGLCPSPTGVVACIPNEVIGPLPAHQNL